MCALCSAPALLRRVQGQLRTDPGAIALLAIDVDVNLDDVDAVTQSIEDTRCSNASAVVGVVVLGHNFGVGKEAGSILERLSETPGDRRLFIHEDEVTSAMFGRPRSGGTYGSRRTFPKPISLGNAGGSRAESCSANAVVTSVGSIENRRVAPSHPPLPRIRVRLAHSPTIDRGL